ncbi:hypothetical protein GGR57DRAFT_349201 [Xylariaceae sp. FL1272]|nr:hypothetical protein GGR57DRAFT_349201 [Xylariaceae sp. FL1272]
MYQKSAVEEAGCDICEQQFVKSQHISDMVASWLFGSELGAADFQNDMMKVIFRRRAELWSEDVRKGWWSEVPVGSPLDEMFFNAICQTISRLSYTQEYLVQDAIDEFPEHVVAKFARRMAHKSVTGRWDPNDQGDGHEPDNLWAWLQVDDYMVEIEPQPDQGTIIQEGEDKAMNGESEVDKDDEVEDDDEDTMDEEMDDEEHDDRDPMDGLDDCDENADNNREIESESTASDSEDWPRYHDSIVDGL